MSMILFTYRSQTAARKALTVLQQAGIPGKVIRLPEKLSPEGCAYALEVPQSRAQAAAGWLWGRGAAYRASYAVSGGASREVEL